MVSGGPAVVASGADAAGTDDEAGAAEEDAAALSVSLGVCAPTGLAPSKSTSVTIAMV
jgi:hypothetical protein